MNNLQARIHRWERAGLGKAPFRFIGCTEEVYQACPGAPIQPGSSCDYCGQGIRYVCHIRSADGRSFKVGCDCVAKVHERGERILTEVERAKRAIDTEKRHARQDAKIAEAEALLERARPVLEAQPHPYPNPRYPNETLWSHVEWMWRHAGRSGKCKVAKIIVAAAKDTSP